MISVRNDPFSTVISTIMPENRLEWIQMKQEFLEERVKEFFLNHSFVYRVAYVAMHVFRAMAMIGLGALLPWSPLVNTSVCVIGTLIYRFTAETLCCMRFATGALEGQLAWESAKWGAAALANGVAQKHLAMSALGVLSFIPACCWVGGVLILSTHLPSPDGGCPSLMPG
ncbi:MAG: hypothetical protein WB791_00900 [Waddliaceae bacterium]